MMVKQIFGVIKHASLAGAGDERISLLEEALRRPVDIVLLSETRLRDKIKSQGELWTN